MHLESSSSNSYESGQKSKTWNVQRSNGQIEEGWKEESRTEAPDGSVLVTLFKEVGEEEMVKTVPLAKLEALNTQHPPSVGQEAVSRFVAPPLDQPQQPASSEFSSSAPEAEGEARQDVLRALEQTTGLLHNTHGQLNSSAINGALVQLKRARGAGRDLLASDAAATEMLNKLENLLEQQRDIVGYMPASPVLQRDINAALARLKNHIRPLTDTAR